MVLRFSWFKLGCDEPGLNLGFPSTGTFSDITASPSQAREERAGTQRWTKASIAFSFDAYAEFCHATRMEARAMPLYSDQKSTVHVVDDDASMRGALQDLFLSIGLETRTYATARELSPRRPHKVRAAL